MSLCSYHDGVSASACGKVLVAGGYLVLDRAHRGLVIAVDAFFTCRVASVSVVCDTTGADVRGLFFVYSPQKTTVIARYRTLIDKADVIRVERLSGEPNAFIELSIAYSLLVANAIDSSALSRRIARPVIIDCRGDAAFYSADPFTTSTVITTKTGLGSSAALVSSVVAALLTFMVADGASVTRAHNVAQIVHSLAQGKVGSGFDVSAAFFGSQTYRRPLPQYAQTMIQRHAHVNNGKDETVRTTVERDMMIELLDLTRTHDDDPRFPIITPVRLPPMLTMIIADVRGGTSTPAMVRNVLTWKDSTEFDGAMWTALTDDNDKLIDQMIQLDFISRNSPRYGATLSRMALSSLTSFVASELDDANVVSAVECIRSSHVRIRHSLRQIGVLCGADIEPASQTALCDATLSLPGVIMCGVPGAGGNDAVFAVVVDAAYVISAVESTWRQQTGVRRLMVQPTKGGIVISKDVNFASVPVP